jgi:hypothetical protein
MFTSSDLTLLTSFQPYNSFNGGIRVAAKALNGGNPGFVQQVSILTAPGPGLGHKPKPIRQATFTGYGLPPAVVDKIFEDPDFNGVFIA